MREDRLHLLMGNEAAARGAVEASVSVAIGYPGTPSTEVIEILIQWSKETGMRAEWAVNKKVAFDVATGASLGGVRCLVTMKSAGLNVASDSIMSVAYGDIVGGLVIYVADDPGAHAGMEEQDARAFAFTCPLPMIDVTDQQESKDAVVAAFDLSERHKLPVIVRTTSRVAHGKAPVRFEPVVAVERKEPVKRDLARLMRASSAWVKEQHAVLNGRVEAVRGEFESSPLNRLELKPGCRVGVVASGASWGYLQDVLDAHDLSDISLLKVGMVNPLPTGLVKRLIDGVDRLLVLEELEPVIELQVKALIADSGKHIQVVGKLDGSLPRVGEYDFQIVETALGKLLGRALGCEEPELDRLRAEAGRLAPRRSLPFCPGCPHRGTYTALTQALRELGFKKDKVIVTGDIGCTILGMNPPWDSCWMEVSMGASVANAAGFKYAGVKAPVVATIGDSTFFHAGVPPTVNVGWNDTPVVIAVLDNSVTAMTGHQAAPSSGYSATASETKTIRIEEMIRAAGIENVSVVDPYDLKQSREAFREALSYDGPSAVVLRRMCSLVARRRGLFGSPVRVEAKKCTGCLLCVRTLSCPAMSVEAEKMVVDQASCTGCGICAQVCAFDAVVRGGG
jgi:indolepyruvate ferredoxin oxidoreductase alpha subunit